MSVQKSVKTKAMVGVKQVINTKPEIIAENESEVTVIPNEFYPSDHYSLAYNIIIQ